MGQTKAFDNEKNKRRQSWIPGSPLFNSLFSSSPPAIKRTVNSSVHRSNSLNENTPQRPTLTLSQQQLYHQTQSPLPQHQRTSPKKPSALANILYKAKQRHHRRSVTLGSFIPTKEVDDPNVHLPVRLLDKDEYEADKSQLKNDFMNLAFTEEFRSTVNFKKLKHGRILDVGCGSGAWCIDMALKYPHLEVIGIDYEDWFPDETSIPANCQLVHGNILNGLRFDYDLHSFDFIHIRLMSLVLTSRQYELATQYCWKLLKPGATLELLEVDHKMCSVGPITKKMNQEVLTVAGQLGFRINVAGKLDSYAPKDDSLNMEQKYQSLPVGMWGGRLGMLFRDDLLDILRRCQTSVGRYYSRPKDDAAFAADVTTSCREMEQYHTYANFHFLTVNKRPIM
ncbi:S-adenosyl-L-methionine-dependent methyltransferase [Absidia repens]|uniref:S-adenosyl-L-methionine-dependent methyltransferase n=1 Tax=Absidia repens TaxID=90262 RepID=A0A1X2II25_9FUNG|nr:S-adenosyl-L-methionine-dependent methyltransferase [Absidia repens]